MSVEEFRNIHEGMKVRTIYGGIGFVNKKMRNQVSIYAWEVSTSKDYGHCTTYNLPELVEIVL